MQNPTPKKNARDCPLQTQGSKTTTTKTQENPQEDYKEKESNEDKNSNHHDKNLEEKIKAAVSQASTSTLLEEAIQSIIDGGNIAICANLKCQQEVIEALWTESKNLKNKQP